MDANILEAEWLSMIMSLTLSYKYFRLILLSDELVSAHN